MQRESPRPRERTIFSSVGRDFKFLIRVRKKNPTTKLIMREKIGISICENLRFEYVGLWKRVLGLRL